MIWINERGELRQGELDDFKEISLDVLMKTGMLGVGRLWVSRILKALGLEGLT